uniref:Uncharacterized protein n=1 Tax=viral metagenome TaxID=1070528 RepID=A0A2V0RNK5_9ZZZZ
MPTLSNNFGASSIAGTVSCTTSLLTTKFQVTPNSSTVEHFFPFTDLEFSPADASNREIATARVPAVMHITADGISANRKKGENAPKNVGDGRESYPLDYDSFDWPESEDDPNYESNRTSRAHEQKSWFGRGMVDFLWGYDHLGRDKKGADANMFEQAFSEEEAVKLVADHPTLSKIVYVVTPRTVKFFYHDSFIRQVVSRMRELFESLGSATPSVCFLGLGDLPNSVQRVRSVDVPGSSRSRVGRGKSSLSPKEGFTGKGNYKVTRPSRLWGAGALGWKGGRYQAQGSIYIPMDYVPYSTLKRSARYNHILNQLGLEWMDSLTAIGSDWKTAKASELSDEQRASAGPKEKIAMLNLFIASLPSFGVTDNPSPSDAMLDDGTVAANVRQYLTMPFSSAYTHLDVGLLASIKEFTDDTGIISDDEKLFGKPARTAFHDFLKNHFIFSIGLACLEAKWKLTTYPAVFMYEGGPRPEHVQQRMLMNFRPDRDYGGGSNLPYTLIPTSLNPGETKARVPTMMHLARESTSGSGKNVNMYLGPRDPVVIDNVKASQYFGDRSETIIEDEFYYASPIITREGSTQSTYRNYRTINIVNVQRPPFFTPGSTVLGTLLGMCGHHGMVQGPVYEQVMGLPWYHVDKNLKREVFVNRSYDRVLDSRSDPLSAKAMHDKRAAAMLNGQGHDVAGLQARTGMAKKDNPQKKATLGTADDAQGSTDIIHY